MNLVTSSNFSSNLNSNGIDDILLQHEIHPSIMAIKQRILVENPIFTLKDVSKDKVNAIIKNLDPKKV